LGKEFQQFDFAHACRGFPRRAFHLYRHKWLFAIPGAHGCKPAHF
jgi:hypothetical protein